MELCLMIEGQGEQMQIVRGHFGEGPFSFSGEHYSVRELDARPTPVQQLLHCDLDAVALMGREIAPALR